MALGGAQVEEFVVKLRKRGVKSLLIGGQHLLSQSFWRAAGATAEGIYVIAPIGSLTNPEYRSAADLLTQSGIVPDLVALYSYVAVQTWAEAVRQAGGGEFKGVAEALRSREFTTALGRVAFDQKGDRRDIDFSIITWQKGLLRELRMVAQVPAAPSQAVAPGPAQPSLPPILPNRYCGSSNRCHLGRPRFTATRSNSWLTASHCFLPSRGKMKHCGRRTAPAVTSGIGRRYANRAPII